MPWLRHTVRAVPTAGAILAPARLEVRSTREVTSAEQRRLRTLLEDAFDGDFSEDDWQHAVGGWHAIVTVEGRPIAHAAVVPRELRIGGACFVGGYVEGVATAVGARRRGHAVRAMTAAMQLIRRDFAIGALSTGQHGFYERLGWERWLGPSFVLRDGAMLRTADDDDGIMVLRFGSSADVSLRAPITCTARNGDDW